MERAKLRNYSHDCKNQAQHSRHKTLAVLFIDLCLLYHYVVLLGLPCIMNINFVHKKGRL